MSILGNKTINYNVYDRSNGRAELVCDTTSYKRPSLETLTDTVKGAGIMGEIDMPSLGQLAAMEIELALKRTNAKAAELFGQKTHDLEVRWASDEVDTATGKLTSVANKDIIRGFPKKLDMGSVETNSANENTMSFEVVYYQHIVNGKSLIEIDKFNNVLKIMGVDYAAKIREAL